MENIGSSCLHASDVDRIEHFNVHVSVGFLLHDELAILDLNVLSIEFGVEPDVGIVRVLLEVVDHPVIRKLLGFVVFEQVFDIGIL